MTETSTGRGADEMTPEALGAAEEALGGAGPVQMVNLLRYRSQAEYGSDRGQPPSSGREAYFARYVPAFGAVAAGLAVEGIKIVWTGSARACVIAPDGEEWDDVAIVEYPDFAAFRRVVESAEYARDADPHRQAALRDWRLIATVPMSGLPAGG